MPDTEDERDQPTILGRNGRMGIVDLAQELERLKATTLDVVAPTATLAAKVQQEFPGTFEQVVLDIPDYGKYPLTRHGHEQLAEKTGVPFRYYERMMGARKYELLADNVNAWLAHDHDRRLIRVADGKVRAVLSDRYRVLDNYDLVTLTLERAKEHAAMVHESYLTETRMYIKLVVPEYTAKLAFTEEEKKAHTWHEVGDDEVIPGLVISNSEVGDGAFRVEPFLLRRVCSNVAILEESLYKVHLGSRMELGELVYSDETRKLADAALWSKVRDIIDATFDETLLKAVIAKMQATKSLVLEAPQEALDVVVRDLNLGQDKRDELLRYFAREGDTVFGLVQGITRLAQEFPDNVERQVELERYAGSMVSSPDTWRKTLKVAA